MNSVARQSRVSGPWSKGNGWKNRESHRWRRVVSRCQRFVFGMSNHKGVDRRESHISVGCTNGGARVVRYHRGLWAQVNARRVPHDGGRMTVCRVRRGKSGGLAGSSDLTIIFGSFEFGSQFGDFWEILVSMTLLLPLWYLWVILSQTSSS